MALLLIITVDFQTRTEVPGINGPGVVDQEAVVVGTLMVKTDFAVMAGASDLTMIVGQTMTGQVVGEDRTVHHPLVAAHRLTVAVAHHLLVAAHHPLVTAHHPLGLGGVAEASAVLASTVAKQGTEHQTAQISKW